MKNVPEIKSSSLNDDCIMSENIRMALPLQATSSEEPSSSTLLLKNDNINSQID